MTTLQGSDELLVIPFQVSTTQYAVVVILGDGNLDRIRAYDPVELPVAHLGKRFNGLQLRDVIVTYATLAERRELERLASHGEVREGLRLVTRGFRYRPDRGDHDDALKVLVPRT